MEKSKVFNEKLETSHVEIKSTLEIVSPMILFIEVNEEFLKQLKLKKRFEMKSSERTLFSGVSGAYSIIKGAGALSDIHFSMFNEEGSMSIVSLDLADRARDIVNIKIMTERFYQSVQRIGSMINKDSPDISFDEKGIKDLWSFCLSDIIERHGEERILSKLGSCGIVLINKMLRISLNNINVIKQDKTPKVAIIMAVGMFTACIIDLLES